MYVNMSKQLETTPNPFKVSAHAIDTAVLSSRNEVELYGRPLAVPNVHVGTELVYAGPPPDWNLPCPPLPEPSQPGTRWWVKEKAVKSSAEYWDYLLENGNHTITHWIGARTLCTYINNNVLRIAPRTPFKA